MAACISANRSWTALQPPSPGGFPCFCGLALLWQAYGARVPCRVFCTLSVLLLQPQRNLQPVKYQPVFSTSVSLVYNLRVYKQNSLQVVDIVPVEQRAQNSRRCPSAHSMLPAFFLSPAWVALLCARLRSRAGCKGPEPCLPGFAPATLSRTSRRFGVFGSGEEAAIYKHISRTS